MTATQERITRIKKIAQNYVDSGDYSSIEWLIYHRGSILDSDKVGYACFDQKTSLPDTPIYRIYSMTKPITAVAAMICYEEGHFQIDDPIAKFLPEFSEMHVWDGNQSALTTLPADRFITVRHLLTHTAGFSYEFMEGGPVEEIYRKNKIIFNGTKSDLLRPKLYNMNNLYQDLL